MSGTIIITGATGSLAVETVRYLISSHPSLTVIGTVRHVPESSKSPYLLQLQAIPREFPKAKLFIKSMDLNSLTEVRSFADDIANQVATGDLPPIAAIICNAFTWSLSGALQFSRDGYESTFQVNHLSHFLLVLKLLSRMDRQSGRVVMLSSEVHDPEHRNPLSKLGAMFPQEDDMEQLVKPVADSPGTEHDMGWRRYATSKLANVMFMHSLNYQLEHNPSLGKITVTAMDPGAILDSRAHNEQRTINRFMFGIMNRLFPLLKFFSSRFRSTADSARDLVALAMDSKYHGVRGYFDGQKAICSASASRDKVRMKALWMACWEWANVEEEETCVGQWLSE
ncbi:uncharacterized protein ATNIH1004_010899 [Aspergillus tanneri]|uniref:3beta-hydroxysteroid 3-dehydrogenase n=1 Tax=Aspergillus tanneri TaxID=1220188 RepID=A0A5M9M906_9EURO|nr:uncharacterized protein ATNIH1004_010899 [Aspergillus tanneri]KAA8641960.1 hypothetical protein ATNIH1004_010899 [Aspergillus tanneri]